MYSYGGYQKKYGTVSKVLLSIIMVLLLPAISMADNAEYSIDIGYQTVYLTGKKTRAMTMNGRLPGPVLYAKEGDLLKVTFNNMLDEPASIYWQGLPYLPAPAIEPGTSFTYVLPVSEHGTYWYHSVSGLQLQRGLYGALVIRPKKETINSDRDYVAVISDWIDENPAQVLRNLKKEGRYYSFKKRSIFSAVKLFKKGLLRTHLRYSAKRMSPADLSDVGYDLFLTNGEAVCNLGPARKGERVRVRIINAGSSTYFAIEFSGGDFEIVSSDGQDVAPVLSSGMVIAPGETYDIIAVIPEDMAYELRATAQDGTGYTSAIIGEGVLKPSRDIPSPDISASYTDERFSEDTALPEFRPSRSVEAFDYGLLRAPSSQAMPAKKAKEIRLDLTGDTKRYVWGFNGRTYSSQSPLYVSKGDVVRLVLSNSTDKHHPVHLQGHLFQVITAQGQFSSLKHTVDVGPFRTVEMQFLAENEGEWLLQSNNSYRLAAGMALVVAYDGAGPAGPAGISPGQGVSDDARFFSGEVLIMSNKSQGRMELSGLRDTVRLDFDIFYNDAYNTDIRYLRHMGAYTGVFAGLDFKEKGSQVTRSATAGVEYMLPFFIKAEAIADTSDVFILRASARASLTDRIYLDWESSTSGCHTFILEYRVTGLFSIVADYEYSHGVGAGLKARF